MPATVTSLDESIAEAKRQLDNARRDGVPSEIRMWAQRLDTRLDRKLALMKAANEGA